MSMILAALEFYLDNRRNFAKLASRPREPGQASPERSAPSGLPSWLDASALQSLSAEDELRLQSCKLEEEFAARQRAWARLERAQQPDGDPGPGPKRMGRKKVHAALASNARVRPRTRVDLEGQPNRQLKIVYATRTHSQIGEFVAELRAVCRQNQLDLRVVHLGARKLLCANPRLRGRARSAFFDELCRLERSRKACGLYRFGRVFNAAPEALVG